MAQPCTRAFWAGALLSFACLAGSPATAETALAPDQLVNVEIHSDSGEILGVINHVANAGGPAEQVVIAVARSDHKLVAIPRAQLRVTNRPGVVDVVAGYGVLGTAAPGVTGPFGTAHLASTDAAMQVQPEGGPPGTLIVLPGATLQSLQAMPSAK